MLKYTCPKGKDKKSEKGMIKMTDRKRSDIAVLENAKWTHIELAMKDPWLAGKSEEIKDARYKMAYDDAWDIIECFKAGEISYQTAMGRMKMVSRWL